LKNYIRIGDLPSLRAAALVFWRRSNPRAHLEIASFLAMTEGLVYKLKSCFASDQPSATISPPATMPVNPLITALPTRMGSCARFDNQPNKTTASINNAIPAKAMTGSLRAFSCSVPG